MRGISPIVSSIIVFIVAISVLTILVMLTSIRGEHTVALIGRESTYASKVVSEKISPVLITMNDSYIMIALYNYGYTDTDIIGIYINGAPINDTVARCSYTQHLESLPIHIPPDTLCIIYIPKRISVEKLTITLSTKFNSYTIPIT